MTENAPPLDVQKRGRPEVLFPDISAAICEPAALAMITSQFRADLNQTRFADTINGKPETPNEYDGATSPVYCSEPGYCFRPRPESRCADCDRRMALADAPQSRKL